MPRPARALLPIPLGRGTAHLTARFGVVRTAAAIRIDAQHGLVNQRIVALHAEDALVQLHRGDGSAGRIENLRLCHSLTPFAVISRQLSAISFCLVPVALVIAAGCTPSKKLMAES